MLVVTVMLALTLLVPFAQRMFRFGPLHADDLAVTVAAGLATILILEFLKPHWRKRLLEQKPSDMNQIGFPDAVEM
jgi:Ca2+-transporting ATPase